MQVIQRAQEVAECADSVCEFTFAKANTPTITSVGTENPNIVKIIGTGLGGSTDDVEVDIGFPTTVTAVTDTLITAEATNYNSAASTIKVTTPSGSAYTSASLSFDPSFDSITPLSGESTGTLITINAHGVPRDAAFQLTDGTNVLCDSLEPVTDANVLQCYASHTSGLPASALTVVTAGTGAACSNGDPANCELSLDDNSPKEVTGYTLTGKTLTIDGNFEQVKTTVWFGD